MERDEATTVVEPVARMSCELCIIHAILAYYLLVFYL